jgi:exosome complex RNA-binding protein Rrp4
MTITSSLRKGCRCAVTPSVLLRVNSPTISIYGYGAEKDTGVLYRLNGGAWLDRKHDEVYIEKIVKLVHHREKCELCKEESKT